MARILALSLPVAPSPQSKSLLRLPALASLAIRGVVEGPPVSGRVLGVSRFAVWVAVGNTAENPAEYDACLVVGTTDAVRLPNSLTIAATAAAKPFLTVEPHQPVAVGDRSLHFGHLLVERVRLRVEPVRWWDPRPKLPPTSAVALRTRLEQLSQHADAGDDPLGVALAHGDLTGASANIIARLGRGSGLTPYEDDVVSGALAALGLVGEALGGEASRHAASFVQHMGDVVRPVAQQRTTMLSATLLQHAIDGEVAMPVARLLRALIGDGDVAPAAGELLRVGHSSGIGLTKGVLIGARAALAMSHPS